MILFVLSAHMDFKATFSKRICVKNDGGSSNSLNCTIWSRHFNTVAKAILRASTLNHDCDYSERTTVEEDEGDFLSSVEYSLHGQLQAVDDDPRGSMRSPSLSSSASASSEWIMRDGPRQVSAVRY